MSGTVRVECEVCGDCIMRIAALHVRECADTGEAEYVFRCPFCDHINIRPIHPSIKASLFAHPLIEVERWSLPAELGEFKSHPPMTLDDIEFFRTELERL